MHMTGLMCQQKVPQQQGEGGRVYTCNYICGPQAVDYHQAAGMNCYKAQTCFAQDPGACGGEQRGSCTVSQTLSGTMQCVEVTTADPPRANERCLTIAEKQQSLSACRLCESSVTTTAATHYHPAPMLCRRSQ